MHFLEFQKYSAYYKLKGNKYFAALREIDLCVDAGELLVIVGPSGCGKTTLLRAVMGFQELAEGKILWNGQNKMDPTKENIGYVAQDYSLYPAMTVYENIAYPLRQMHTDLEQIDRRVRQIARQMDIELLLTRKPRQLSGGQQQRVAIARALIKNPELLLFDEPFSNLEPEMRLQLRTLVKSIHQQLHSTILFVTHDLQEAAYLAQHVLVLDKGRIVQSGSPQEIAWTELEGKWE